MSLLGQFLLKVLKICKSGLTLILDYNFRKRTNREEKRLNV